MKKEHDFSVTAFRVVQEATGESRFAKSGRQGGLKGGHARAVKLSPERRREIAKKAAYIRWSK